MSRDDTKRRTALENVHIGINLSKLPIITYDLYSFRDSLETIKNEKTKIIISKKCAKDVDNLILKIFIP